MLADFWASSLCAKFISGSFPQDRKKKRGVVLVELCWQRHTEMCLPLLCLHRLLEILNIKQSREQNVCIHRTYTFIRELDNILTTKNSLQRLSVLSQGGERTEMWAGNADTSPCPWRDLSAWPTTTKAMAGMAANPRCSKAVAGEPGRSRDQKAEQRPKDGGDTGLWLQFTHVQGQNYQPCRPKDFSWRWPFWTLHLKCPAASLPSRCHQFPKQSVAWQKME